MIVQPDLSRFTLTIRPLPSELLLPEAEDRPLLDDDTEIELRDEFDPELRVLAKAPLLPASTIVTTTRPSAV